jgi:hypothetical protein
MGQQWAEKIGARDKIFHKFLGSRKNVSPILDPNFLLCECENWDIAQIFAIFNAIIPSSDTCHDEVNHSTQKIATYLEIIVAFSTHI